MMLATMIILLFLSKAFEQTHNYGVRINLHAPFEIRLSSFTISYSQNAFLSEEPSLFARVSILLFYYDVYV